jgi:HK97 family phage major capsid protein
LERGTQTGDETEKFKKMDADIDALTATIDREERLLKHEADAARTAFSQGKEQGDGANGVRYLNTATNRLRTATQEQIDKHMPYVIQGWLRAKAPDAEFDQEHIEAGKFFGVDLRAKELKLPISRDYRKVAAEYRNMSLTAAAGGYTVPQGFVNALEMALLQFGGVRQVSDIIRTEGGSDLPWPTMNDTSNKGEIIGEASTFGNSVDPTFASVIFKAFKYSSKPIVVSTELLQDSAFDLAAQIGGWLGTRIGRIQNDHFTTGAGTTLPKGLTVAGVVGKTATATNTFTDVEVIDLQHSVDPAYRPNASWMFHDAVLAHIRKMKDATTGQYLWQPGMQAGVPDRLLGNTYSINQSMASAFTTGQKLVLYGDFSKYKIRDVRDVRLVRLDELFAQTDQVGFVAFMRTDGNLLDAGTRPVKWLALA